jgi:HemY protein
VRGVIWLILLFVVAVVAATTLGRNDGLVSIFWGGWRTDVSLNLFVLAIVVGCALLMTALQAVSGLLALPRRAGEWRALTRERAGQAALREALAEYFGGRYSRAHKAAQRALAIQADTELLREDTEFTALAHLLAAGSLHRLQDGPRRDEQLERVLRLVRKTGTGRSADDGARLLAAEWALDDRDSARALDLLAELPPGVARRTQALRLKLRAARMAGQPLPALATAHLLAKHQAFSPAAAQGLLRSLAVEALDAVHDVDQLRRLWQQLDAADRRDVFVSARAAMRAAALGADAEGRAWLRPFWERLADTDRDGREQLALALVACMAGIGTDWLPRLEMALQTHGHEAAVAAAVGEAFAECGLWGKARRLLEQAAAAPTLPAAARRRAWRRLAQLARDEGDEARAGACEHAASALD